MDEPYPTTEGADPEAGFFATHGFRRDGKPVPDTDNPATRHEPPELSTEAMPQAADEIKYQGVSPTAASRGGAVMAFTQTAHSLDPAKPGASLMSVTNERVKRAIVPISAAMTRREYVPAYTWNGGVYGDDQVLAKSNVLVDDRGVGDYTPRNQDDKAIATGNTIAVDVTAPRGYIGPKDPYSKPAPLAPVITSLAPNTVAAGSPSPLAVVVTGTGFTQWTFLLTGNVQTPYAKYVSPTKMTLLLDPQRSVVGTIEVKAVDHSVVSSPATFTFT